MKSLIAVAMAASMLSGCAGMNDTQQRALTGTVGGAAIGAGLGAIGGNAGLGAIAGAGAGLTGGLIVDRVRRNEQAAFQAGVNQGRQQRPN